MPIKKHKSTAAVTIKAILTAMGNVYFGYCLSYYGSAQNSVAYILGYQDSSHKYFIDGLINAVLPIGGAIGAFGSTKLTQKFGLRRSFIICDIFGVMIVIASLYLNYVTITVTRFLYGVVVGCNSALVPQYINSITPKTLSGILGAFSNVALLVGLTSGFVLSWICLQNKPITYIASQDYGIYGFNSWRIMFAFPAIVCLIRLFAFVLLYKEDLASELLRKGHHERARIVLKKQYKPQYEWEMMQELEQDLQLEGMKTITYRDLCGKLYRKRLYIGMVLSMLNQWSGINAINFYSSTVFDQITNKNFTWVQALTVGDGVVSIFSSIVSGLIINKFGRRIMFLIGNAVCFVSLAFLTLLYLELDLQGDNISVDTQNALKKCVIIALFSFIIAFSMSLGPVFWVYTQEILPPKGIGLILVQDWLSLALLAQFFPIVAGKTQVSVCFGFFALISFVGEVFIYYEVKETRTLTKTQIHNMYSPYHMPASGKSSALDGNVYKDTISPLIPYVSSSTQPI